MRIDAHQHFWRLDRGDYFWMDDSVAPIQRDLGPGDLLPLRTEAGIDGTVVVQAAPTVAESEYLLSLADEDQAILGVVGWVDLSQANARSDLQHLAAHSRFKGVRPMLQDIEDTSWILRDEVISNLEIVAATGLRLDALITPRHLDAISDLADRIPELPIVIDHCAKPPIQNGQDAGEEWRAGIARLAQAPQIVCKLSGLANEFGAGWNADKLRPVFDHVLDCFGAERLMWGSDWPVLDLAGTYQNWYHCALSLASTLSTEEQDNLFGETATRFYGLKP